MCVVCASFIVKTKVPIYFEKSGEDRLLSPYGAPDDCTQTFCGNTGRMSSELGLAAVPDNEAPPRVGADLGGPYHSGVSPGQTLVINGAG